MIKERLIQLLKNEIFKKNLFYITLATAILILILAVKADNSSYEILVDENGNLTGINRASLLKSEEYSLVLEIQDKNRIIEKELVITAPARQKNNEKKNKKNREEIIDSEINAIIIDIETDCVRNIKLPQKLSDGSRLVWHMNKKNDSDLLLIVLLYLMLILALATTSLKENNTEEKEIRTEIMRALPRFTNQLMLMMNAGMILSDAFEKISYSYKLFSNENTGYLEKELIALAEKNADHRKSTASIINEFATEHRVKELMRISTILTENEKRGSDVIDNLSRESQFLWDERKISARERGKLIDTKMSYPLGILLVLLIVITMAPALLVM